MQLCQRPDRDQPKDNARYQPQADNGHSILHWFPGRSLPENDREKPYWLPALF